MEEDGSLAIQKVSVPLTSFFFVLLQRFKLPDSLIHFEAAACLDFCLISKLLSNIKSVDFCLV